MFTKLSFSLLITGLLLACQPQQTYVQLNGFTMGTTYQVTLENNKVDTTSLQLEIDTRLQQINQLMSTYIEDSELSTFNQNTSADCLPLSVETLYVINNALEISRKSQGKFDVTLAPLIEIWGFDKKDTHHQIPPQLVIDELLSQIGYEKLRVETDCIAKKLAHLSVNLSAIAKGYAVDQIAKVITKHQIDNYLVEIGGEIANRGVNAKGQQWRIAIESASTQARSVQRVIAPKGKGIATSGDYRNYFEKDGKRFSHTIDPTTGYPITHNLASITVLHSETMIADALATAMMVMGPELALEFANKELVPVFMLVKTDVGFDEVFNDLMQQHLQ